MFFVFVFSIILHEKEGKPKPEGKKNRNKILNGRYDITVENSII